MPKNHSRVLNRDSEGQLYHKEGAWDFSQTIQLGTPLSPLELLGYGMYKPLLSRTHLGLDATAIWGAVATNDIEMAGYDPTLRIFDTLYSTGASGTTTLMDFSAPCLYYHRFCPSNARDTIFRTDTRIDFNFACADAVNTTFQAGTHVYSEKDHNSIHKIFRTAISSSSFRCYGGPTPSTPYILLFEIGKHRVPNVPYTADQKFELDDCPLELVADDVWRDNWHGFFMFPGKVRITNVLKVNVFDRCLSNYSFTLEDVTERF